MMQIYLRLEYLKEIILDGFKDVIHHTNFELIKKQPN